MMTGHTDRVLLNSHTGVSKRRQKGRLKRQRSKTIYILDQFFGGKDKLVSASLSSPYAG